MIAAALAFAVAAAPVSAARSVPQAEIVDAMRQSGSYDVSATTNGPRFQAEVLLRLAAQARGRDPGRLPLFIDHHAWFHAYLERARLTAERAPLFVRLSHEHRQDMHVDYRAERVFRAAAGAPTPRAALNVCIWWPKTAGAPESYTYEDALATPRLKVTNERVISYRLLEFDDQIAFTDVRGLRGRPTTGALGLLFQVIGEGSVVENRMAVAADGLQAARARARKFMIEVASTVTVYPNGRTEKDVPPGRTDMAEIERRLKRSIDVDHPPLRCPPF